MGNKPSKPKKIAILPKTGDRSHRHPGHEGLVPELLPGRRIGEVNLHHRQTHPGEAVSQGDAGMGESGRIDEDSLDLSGGILQVIQDFPLVVGLEEIQLDTQLPGHLPELSVDLFQRVCAVDVGLPLTQQAKVGSVDDGDL